MRSIIVFFIRIFIPYIQNIFILKLSETTTKLYFNEKIKVSVFLNKLNVIIITEVK